MEEKQENISRQDGDILADYIIGEFKLTMWVPDELAGRVVGKKGVTITNLQRETKAKLINALLPVGGSLWAPVVIIGEWKSVTAAYKAISEMVFDEVDDVVLEFTINTRKPFFLYGKQKYHTLRVISAKSNVRIFVPENLKEHPIPPVTLEGSFENVRKSLLLLEEEAIEYRERQKEKLKNLKSAASESATNVAAATTTTTASSATSSTQNKDKICGAQNEAKKADKVGNAGKSKEAVGEKVSNTLKPNTNPPSSSSSSLVTKDVSNDDRVAVKSETVEMSDESKGKISAFEELTKVESNDANLKTNDDSTNISDAVTSDVVKDASKDKEGNIIHAKSLKSIRVTIERLIYIPANLVGLLLSKRNVKSSVMNQIQALTNTTISKVLPNASASTQAKIVLSEEKEEVAKSGEKERGRRRALSDEDEDRDNVDDNDDGSTHSDDSSENGSTSSNSTTSSVSGKDEREIKKPTMDGKDEPPVAFRIIGQNAKYVDIAFDQLTRIIKGDRIKEVMDSLVLQTSTLNPHHKEYRKPGRGSGRERERGADRTEKKRDNTSSAVPQERTTANKDDSGKAYRGDKKDRKRTSIADQGDEKKEWNKVEKGEKRLTNENTKRSGMPKRGEPRKSSEK